LKNILPLVLALLGLGAGIGGGILFRPDRMALTSDIGSDKVGTPTPTPAHPTETLAASAEPDYVKLNNQFVVSVVSDGNVSSLVVMTLSIELASGGPEQVYKQEPKLRDAFLQVMFDHANSGGFDGNFTMGRNMDQLRTALREAAQKILGSAVADILIVDVLRQDV